MISEAVFRACDIVVDQSIVVCLKICRLSGPSMFIFSSFL